MRDDILDLFHEALHKVGENYICKYLCIHKGTLKRWKKKESVPDKYYIDLCRLLERKIDLSMFSFSEKDQFFTKIETAKRCFSIFLDKIKELGEIEEEFCYIESSAGNGSFFNILPENRKIGIDIEPMCKDLIKMNFLNWVPTEKKKYVVIGNPPFGLRGNLALRFINHSYYFADYVAFILPQLFESDGKGSTFKRVKGFNLIHSSKLESDFEFPNGEDVKINSVFQIWSKYHSLDKNNEKCESYIKIYSLSDGGTPSSTRNKKMIGNCDFYIPSTCFGSDNMRLYNSFHNLPGKKGYGITLLKDKENLKNVINKIEWNEECFKSTNSALNLRTSLIKKAIMKRGFVD